MGGWGGGGGRVVRVCECGAGGVACVSSRARAQRRGVAGRRGGGCGQAYSGQAPPHPPPPPTVKLGIASQGWSSLIPSTPPTHPPTQPPTHPPTRAIRACHSVGVEGVSPDVRLGHPHARHGLLGLPHALNPRLRITGGGGGGGGVRLQTSKGAPPPHPTPPIPHPSTPLTSSRGSPILFSERTTAFAVPLVSALERWCDSTTDSL